MADHEDFDDDLLDSELLSDLMASLSSCTTSALFLDLFFWRFPGVLSSQDLGNEVFGFSVVFAAGFLSNLFKLEYL